MKYRWLLAVILPVVLLSCTTPYVKPAVVENTPSQRLSEEEREYLVESYKDSYLKAIREKSELEAFAFPLLKEAAQVASSIRDDVVPKKFRKYHSMPSYGFSDVGSHLIRDRSDESLVAWKRLGVSMEDTFRTVFQVFKGGVAERAGLVKGDSLWMKVSLFIDNKGKLYKHQYKGLRREYSLSVAHENKKGELIGISDYDARTIKSNRFFDLFDFWTTDRRFYMDGNGQLYTRNWKTTTWDGKTGWARQDLPVHWMARPAWKGGVFGKPDELLSVPIGIDTENPKAAYCSEDLIVIGSHWVENQPVYGAYVLAHELAHFIMGDVGITLNNVKAKQEREAIKNAMAGALIGAATGAVSGAVSDQNIGQSATAGAIHGASWGAAYGSAVGAYLGRYMYSHEMEYNADKIALYILARAGYDLEKVKNFWIDEAPYLGFDREGMSHPSMQDRSNAMARTIVEIRFKQRAGLDLLPFFHTQP